MRSNNTNFERFKSTKREDFIPQRDKPQADRRQQPSKRDLMWK